MHNLPLETALDRAVAAMGTVAALAAEINVAASLPSMWRKRAQVPAKHCPAIERATGGAVRCEDLRPDIEWGVLRAPAVEVRDAA
jgi:DNA-binding transcriptional regulator YdaS (Cro superfamily)